MKTLFLLRHAHTEPPGPGQDDHDRVLSPRGETEAENVGGFMQEQKLVPEAVFSSTSMRTRETVRLAFTHIGKGVSIRYDRELYLAPPDVIMEEINEADDRINSLMIVGHNPGFEDLAERLAAASGQMIGKFPPCAMAVYTCDIDSWQDFSAKKCRLKTVFMP